MSRNERNNEVIVFRTMLIRLWWSVILKENIYTGYGVVRHNMRVILVCSVLYRVVLLTGKL